MKPSQITLRPRRMRVFLASMMVFATLGTASSVMPTPAFAQSADEIEQAKELFFAGQKAYQDEDFNSAAESFLAAYKLSGRAELLYNVGKSYWQGGKLVEAQDYLQQYINAMPEASNAEEVIEAIIEIQQEMVSQMATVNVSASQAKLSVYVSDEADPRCKLPCSVSLMPGEHTLSVRIPGGDTLSRKIAVQAEEQTSLHFDTPGQLHIRSDQRSGSVDIAGVGQYALPMDAPISLRAGSHNISATGPDGAHWQGSIEVESGELTEISLPMASSVAAPAGEGISTLRTVSFALAGLAVGLGAGGVVMGMQAGDTHDSLNARQSALGSVDPLMLEQGRSQQLGANILYAASAVSLLAGAGLFTWDLMSDDSEQIPPSEPVRNAPPDATAEADADEDLLGL